VQTEVDGKPTGWKAYFDGGKWTVEDKRTKPKAE
jgi:DNA topoisomerase-1